MATKIKLNPFQVRCKLLFSSLSARRCSYIYLNIPGYTDSIILSNADSAELSNYRPYTCAIHRIIPKDSFLEELRAFLKIDTETPYIFRAEFLLRAFTTTAFEDITLLHKDGLVSILDNSTNAVLIVKTRGKKDDEEPEKDGAAEPEEGLEDTETDDGAVVDTEIFSIQPLSYPEICGVVFNVPYAMDCLLDILDTAARMFREIKEGTRQAITKQYTAFPERDFIHSIWFKSDPLPDTGQTLLFMDGYDNPSVVEFFPKVCSKKNGLEGSYFRYVYHVTDTYMQSMATFEDETLFIHSFRPFANHLILKPREHVAPES